MRTKKNAGSHRGLLGSIRNDSCFGYESHGFGRCAVVLRETGDLVGDCGLIPTVVEDRSEIELGWIVGRDHWGQGIATEAAVAWRNFAFDTLRLDRIVSMISGSNIASRRVAEKLGMQVEREALWGGLPHLMYSLQVSGPAN